MRKQEIELKIKKLQKIRLDAQRKVDAKRDIKMAQILVESCDKEIKELEEVLKNM